MTAESQETDQSEDYLDTLFKDRYTEKDPEYASTINRPAANPPCVENWYTRAKRQWNRGGGRGYNNRDNRGRGNSDGYRGGRYNQREQYGHNDHRGRGGGGGGGGGGYQRNRDNYREGGYYQHQRGGYQN